MHTFAEQLLGRIRLPVGVEFCVCHTRTAKLAVGLHPSAALEARTGQIGVVELGLLREIALNELASFQAAG